MKQTIMVETTVNSPVEKVWTLWTQPGHITQWNNASDDWHTPYAENDVRAGGKFLFRMAARDGSVSFDFTGVYKDITPNRYINYMIDDGRKVQVSFTPIENQTRIVETFEAEEINTVELQRGGWQAIMDSFKKYAEQN